MIVFDGNYCGLQALPPLGGPAGPGGAEACFPVPEITVVSQIKVRNS